MQLQVLVLAQPMPVLLLVLLLVVSPGAWVPCVPIGTRRVCTMFMYIVHVKLLLATPLRASSYPHSLLELLAFCAYFLPRVIILLVDDPHTVFNSTLPPLPLVGKARGMDGRQGKLGRRGIPG